MSSIMFCKITHSCGHESIFQYDVDDRNAGADCAEAQDQPCHDCWAADVDAQNDAWMIGWEETLTGYFGQEQLMEIGRGHVVPPDFCSKCHLCHPHLKCGYDEQALADDDDAPNVFWPPEPEPNEW